MYVYHLFLVILLALVACCGTLADPEAADTSTATVTRRIAGRLLRAEDALDEDQDATEDRVNILDKFLIQRWIKAGKSEDDVKNTLGMATMMETQLRNHKDYHIFEAFQLRKWYKDELTTGDVWMSLNLQNVRDDRLSTDIRFQTYMNYVNLFDDRAIQALKAGKNTPPLLSSPISEEEMTQRVTIWAINRRPNDYVEKVLGVSGISAGVIIPHANDKFYVQYLRLKQQLGNLNST